MNTYLIAEIGQAHEGSLGILHSYIDALSKTGVDAVKFQTHIADAESSPYEPFRVKFSYEDNTRYDYWKRMEFSEEQWHGIKEHCDKVGVDFISSPFSNAAVDLLEKMKVKKYKVGSGEMNNFLLLEKLKKTKKEIILSSGMSSLSELDETFRYLNDYKEKISILQCTTSYPTNPEDIGLNVINVLKSRYSVPVGLSDHSGKIYPSLAASTLGASILEFHAVFDRRMFGPDSLASLTIDEIKILVEGVRFLEKARTPVDKNNNSKYQDLKDIFEKSLCVNQDLKIGDVLTFNLLESKKPAGFGISAKNFQKVIGRELKNPLNKWDFINENDML